MEKCGVAFGSLTGTFSEETLKMKAARQLRDHKQRNGKQAESNGTDQGFMRLYPRKAPVADKWNGDFVFTLPFALSTAAAVNTGGSEQIFTLNSLFQPDYTGSSHQPYGFDQFVPTLYGRFIVKAVAVDIRVMTQPATKNMAVGISVQPSGSTYTMAGANIGNVIEKQMDTVVYLNSTGMASTRKFAFPLHVIEGISKLQYDAELDDYSGSSSANPSKVAYLRVCAFNLQDNTSPTVNVIVSLRYKAQLYLRTFLPTS